MRSLLVIYTRLNIFYTKFKCFSAGDKFCSGLFINLEREDMLLENEMLCSFMQCFSGCGFKLQAVLNTIHTEKFLLL